MVYLGAAYLIYLGLKSLLSKANHLEFKNTTHTKPPLHIAFRDGFLTNVLNPKCTLFMLSVFTVIIHPHTSIAIQTIYAAQIILITAGWFVFLSYGLTLPIIKNKIEKVQHVISKLIGGILLTLGIAVLFESR